eukprot:COSAG02_NODE_1182_length_14021_cov_4.502442_12_plen_176_part_00
MEQEQEEQEDAAAAKKSLVAPVQPIPAEFSSLTPEQLAKHQAYRAKRKQKKYIQQQQQLDAGLPLTRTPSPPMSPPTGPVVQNKLIAKKTAATKQQAAPTLSAHDKKLLLNRSVNYKQNKLQKLKAEALLLEATLQAKEQQHTLLLTVLASAKAAVAKAAHQPMVAVAATVVAGQ